MNTCYIVCALNCKLDFSPDESDLVIGADRGYLTLDENGIKPDIVIGDFDSYTGEIRCESVIKFPVKKDFTDSALAIEHAIKEGYKRIMVYGAIGGALDHTIANLALIANYTSKGYEIAFFHNDNVVFALHNSVLTFSSEANGRISVFSFMDKAFGVNEKGLLYELENATLENLVPLGISNEFIGKSSAISVDEGTLIVYTSRENYENHLTKH